MKRWIVIVAAAASFAMPVASQAQPAGGPGPGGGPPPEARARFQTILGEARTAAFNAVGPDHREAVRAVVAQVAARTLDRRAARQKIDGLLSADERSRLTAVEQKMRAEMRTAMSGMGAPPGGGPPGGSDQAGGRQLDPGRFLLMVSRSRRFRGPEPRSSGAP